MKFINQTTSLCDKCYRHIPAHVYEFDDSIVIKKTCEVHGNMFGTVEIDKDFYFGLNHKQFFDFNVVLFEASDRCQLNCPHCYHLPDNKVQDKSIDTIIDQVSLFPNNVHVMIAGAEPTLRPDFVEMISELKKLNFPKLEILSNGLKFANEKWTSQVFDAGASVMCFGLNHPSYQGLAVHSKQLKALEVLKHTDFEIGYVGYTIESYDHLPFILSEIKNINHKNINHFRIRCGSFIGRSSDKQRSYLSTLYKEVKRITKGNITLEPADDNPYHIMVNWDGIVLRLIQWPDVTNIDLDELSTGPWCQFYDGPITNFVHQVITRDAFKNNKLPMLDTVPEKYQYRPLDKLTYWKEKLSYD